MKILICGIDGYLGWTLAQYLTVRGHEVAGVDNFLRRKCVKEEGAQSLIPVKPIEIRLDAFKKKYGTELKFFKGDVGDYELTKSILTDFKADAIVHLGEIPSAPYSMIDFDHAWDTHDNNLKGTLALLFAMRDIVPNAHLVKLGTMGEYGTPKVDIPEGFFDEDATFRGKSLEGVLFPRHSGSWYHMTKIHDTNNVEMACRLWGLKSTDIMQGVVYGTRTPEMLDANGDLDENLCTRFDFGECFGTAINRFCAQAAIGHPLTLYGVGHMKRGFLTIEDSMQCMTLAIENPPVEGEHGTRKGYRVFNQFEESYDITELAQKVVKVGQKIGLDTDLVIKNIENPRIEDENNYYNPDHQHLLDLGYKPTKDMEGAIETMLHDVVRFKDRILECKEAIMPNIGFDGIKKMYGFLTEDELNRKQGNLNLDDKEHATRIKYQTTK